MISYESFDAAKCKGVFKEVSLQFKLIFLLLDNNLTIFKKHFSHDLCKGV